MSGLYADTAGRGSVEAAKMAVADFGGQVLGKKIEVVWADHQNKADVGATHARTWFDRDGVDLIVDINNTAVAIAVNNLARERGKMVINTDRKSTRLNSSHSQISYAVFCLKKKKRKRTQINQAKKSTVNTHRT